MHKKKEDLIKEDQPMNPTPPVRLLTLQQVLKMTTVSRSTWYRGMNDGRYPKPVNISIRRRVWREDQVASLGT